MKYTVNNKPSKLYFFKRLADPVRFQGAFKKNNYFEGWYYKILTSDQKNSLAFIVGISLHQQDKHAFIQCFDGESGALHYLRFPLSKFSYDTERFAISVENNHFTRDEIMLDLPFCQGKLNFSSTIQYPYKWYAPNVMGILSWFPALEDYHALVSMEAKITGKLSFKQNPSIDFTGGVAYIEKDYGKNFPAGWTWGCAQHFNLDNHKVLLSYAVADVPLYGVKIKGYLAMLYLDGSWHRFATYTRGKLMSLELADKKVVFKLSNSSAILEVEAVYEKGTLLSSPTNQGMTGFVEESAHGLIKIKLRNKKTKELLYTGESVGAMEIGGIYSKKAGKSATILLK